MAILKVARMGHPVLRRKARELSNDDILSDPIQRLLHDMIDTMREYQGVGLAAPQVREDVRLFVVELTDPSGQEDPIIPLTILFNPNITEFSDETSAEWEGCLSIPEIRGLVTRPKSIRIEGLDDKANKIAFKASGFFARVLQHEYDHLDGVLYLDKMDDLKTLSFVDEQERQETLD